MPIAAVTRGAPLREPDAPVRSFARHGAVLRPTACHVARDERALQGELEQMFLEWLDDARDVAISVTGDCVVLQGIVSCPLARLLAEDLVFALPEVWECHNELVVRTDGGAPIAA